MSSYQGEKEPRLKGALDAVGRGIERADPDVNQLAEGALRSAQEKLDTIGDTQTLHLTVIDSIGPKKPINFVAAKRSKSERVPGTRPIDFGEFGNAKIILVKEQERVETITTERKLLGLISLKKTESRTMSPGGGPAQLCAVFENGVAVPFARFADIKGKHSSYVHIGDEIDDDNLLTPRSDESSDTKAMYQLIHALINNGESSKWPNTSGTHQAKQIAAIREIVIDTLSRQKDFFDKASLNNILDQVFYSKNRTTEHFFIKAKPDHIESVKLETTEVIPEFEMPDGRKIRLIVGKQVDPEAELKLYLLVRGFVAVELSAGPNLTAEQITKIHNLFTKIAPELAQLRSARALIREDHMRNRIIQVALQSLLRERLISPSFANELPKADKWEPYGDFLAELQTIADDTLQKDGLSGLCDLLQKERFKLGHVSFGLFEKRYLEAQVRLYDLQRDIMSDISDVVGPVLLDKFGKPSPKILAAETVCELALRNIRSQKILIKKTLPTPIAKQTVDVDYITEIKGLGQGNFELILVAIPPSGVPHELPKFSFNVFEQFILGEEVAEIIDLYTKVLQGDRETVTGASQH